MLASAFERLKRLRFPEFAESDELANWQAQLLELDGHIAGIATTLLAGGQADPSDLRSQLAQLRRQLELITRIAQEDQDVFAKCKEYLNALEELVENMRYSNYSGRTRRSHVEP